MKFTLNWLKQVLGTEDLDAQEIADMLTMSGTEVKKVEYPGKNFKNIIIGRIADYTPHPNADKLSLCKVENGERLLDIVCGASNFKKGDKVALALPGARVGPINIKKSKIRGQVSEGMMCSEAELGISDESGGIMILDPDFKIGQSFARAMELEDIVFELEITPNRPDCLSVMGIAREIAALKRLQFKLPEYDYSDDMADDSNLELEIKDYGLCTRYSAKVFPDVGKAQSPRWLKNRLIFCDVRPQDLVVDLTNYVMLETGQPLHAFDKDLLASDKIIVRPAEDGEKIETIDGSLRELDKDMIVIADVKGPVAIAGIMGGKETEIGESTRSVLLESANFNGPSIMRTSKKLGLRSEASNRFEKKIDPQLTLFAIKRFEQLLKQISGYQGASRIYDNYSKPERQRKIMLRPQKVFELMGEEIETERMLDILNGLGINAEKAGENLKVTVPSFRYEDLEREVDLIEEVARIYGFNNFSSQPPSAKQKLGGYTSYQKALKDIRSCLSDIGLHEVINYSFISKKAVKQFMLDNHKMVRIINPINEDFEYLRSSLLPAMINNVRQNIKYKIEDLPFFEISKVFGKADEKELPNETDMLGVALTGKKQEKSWNQKESYYDFYDLKGTLEHICNVFSPMAKLSMDRKEYPFFHPAVSARIKLGEEYMGIIGKIHPRIAESMEIDQDMYYMELNLGKFIQSMGKREGFKTLPSYPSIDMDMAIVVDEKVTHHQIEKVIWKAGSDILKQVKLFDLYKGKQVEEGKKSMAYSLTFRDDFRTLKDREAVLAMERIIESLAKEFNASLRQ